jgi:hypothetical protein
LRSGGPRADRPLAGIQDEPRGVTGAARGITGGRWSPGTHAPFERGPGSKACAAFVIRATRPSVVDMRWLTGNAPASRSSWPAVAAAAVVRILACRGRAARPPRTESSCGAVPQPQPELGGASRRPGSGYLNLNPQTRPHQSWDHSEHERWFVLNDLFADRNVGRDVVGAGQPLADADDVG